MVGRRVKNEKSFDNGRQIVPVPVVHSKKKKFLLNKRKKVLLRLGDFFFCFLFIICFSFLTHRLTIIVAYRCVGGFVRIFSYVFFFPIISWTIPGRVSG